MTDTDIADAVREIIEAGAPNWFIPAYTKILYVQARLERHLAGHEERRGDWRAIWRPIVQMLLGALVIWLLMQAPAILSAGR